MRMTVRISVALLLVVAFAGPMSPLHAQTGQVTGMVTSQDTGGPLAGAQVSIEGTSHGALTNDRGRYLILGIPVGEHVLVVQSVGYTTERRTITIRADEPAVQDVVLRQTALNLEGLVVVGYGTQVRKDVTGSVSSVKGTDIAQASVGTANIQTALQGRLAGVNVAESSGEPGAAPQVLVRGRGSISAGTEPLYVIDGVPYSSNEQLEGTIDTQNPNFGVTRQNPLANLDPNDIESVEVLKDAAAAAIYGSRGSNGVILITTKRGARDAPPSVHFRAYAGVQNAFHRPKLMNAQQNIEYVKLSRNNNYMTRLDPTNPNSPNYNPDYNPDTNAGRAEHGATGDMMIPDAMVNWDGTNTDWLSAVLNPAALQNYDASVRGGSDNFTYFVSGSDLNQSGVIKGSNFRRLALRSNLTIDANDRLQLNFDFNGAYADNKRKSANAPYFGRPPGIIYSAMVASPVAKIYDDQGNYLQRGTSSINGLGNGMTTSNNPLAVQDYINDRLQTSRIFGSVSGNLSLRDNLKYKLLFGYDYQTTNRDFYQGTQLEYRGSTTPQPYAQAISGQSYHWDVENTMNYSTTLGANSFNVLVGYTAERQFDETKSVDARNFPDDQVQTINGGQISGGSQDKSEWTLVSALGRVNYTLKDRYMATATFRADRSSRFGRGHQTGYFPSLSLGWLVTEEPFMRGVTFLSQLKPRISYGVTGNFQIPNYGSIGLVSSSPYVLGNTVVPGADLATLGNRDLTWETARQVNAGLDFGFLGDRISGSMDYYVTTTKDLLLNVNIPSSSGFATVLTNIGKVRNKGWEAQITSRNLVGSFGWSTDFSFGANKNKVLALGPEGDPILASGVAGIRHITEVGGEIGAYWGYVQDGLYLTQQDIDNGPVDTQYHPTVGDARFKDLNGDGVIDEKDRTAIGSYNPHLTWGVTNRFNWRHLDLNVFVQGVSGRQILNLTRRHLTHEGNFNGYLSDYTGMWISPEQPGNGWIGKPDRDDNGGVDRPSTRQVEDGSYVSLKTISLSYDMPPNVIRGILFGRAPSSVRLFGSVNNVYMWTAYEGWNPEVSVQASGLTPGQDYGAYPLMRAFQFGVDIGF